MNCGCDTERCICKNLFDEINQFENKLTKDLLIRKNILRINIYDLLISEDIRQIIINQFYCDKCNCNITYNSVFHMELHKNLCNDLPNVYTDICEQCNTYYHGLFEKHIILCDNLFYDFLKDELIHYNLIKYKDFFTLAMKYKRENQKFESFFNI